MTLRRLEYFSHLIGKFLSIVRLPFTIKFLTENDLSEKIHESEQSQQKKE